MLIRQHPDAGLPSGRVGTHPEADSRVSVVAPAKVNLYLEIIGRRPDGYHDLATLMLATDLADELRFAADDAGRVSLTCDEPGLATGPTNLIVRAADLLRRRTGCPLGAKIALAKRIPWAAGLGGGSSDAAAALAGLNGLWGLGLSVAELAGLGAELGSDVPFFFAGPAAWCTGRGEVVRPVKSGGFDLVLAKPAEGLDTAAVYREYAAGHAGGSREADPPAGLLDALAAGDAAGVAARLFNRLEGPAFALSAAAADLARRVDELRPLGRLLSGSGACVFALARDRGDAARIRDGLRSSPGAAGGTRAWIVAGADPERHQRQRSTAVVITEVRIKLCRGEQRAAARVLLGHLRQRLRRPRPEDHRGDEGAVRGDAEPQADRPLHPVRVQEPPAAAVLQPLRPPAGREPGRRGTPTAGPSCTPTSPTRSTAPAASRCRRRSSRRYAEEKDRSQTPGYVCTYDDYDGGDFDAAAAEGAGTYADVAKAGFRAHGGHGPRGTHLDKRPAAVREEAAPATFGTGVM